MNKRKANMVRYEIDDSFQFNIVHTAPMRVQCLYSHIFLLRFHVNNLRIANVRKQVVN